MKVDINEIADHMETYLMVFILDTTCPVVF